MSVFALKQKDLLWGKEIFGHFTTRFFGPCCVHNRVGREEEKPSQVYKAILSQYPIFKHSWANIYIWCLQVRGSIARRCLKYLDLMFTFKVSDLGNLPFSKICPTTQFIYLLTKFFSIPCADLWVSPKVKQNFSAASPKCLNLLNLSSRVWDEKKFFSPEFV